MPRGYEIAGDFATRLLLGEDVAVSDAPRYEQVKGEKYDAGDVAFIYSQAWLGDRPNHVTPFELLDLLNFLEAFTSNLEVQNQRNLDEYGAKTCEELGSLRPEQGSICRDLQRWRIRLDEYSMFLASVPIDDQYDREAALWEVTAPLFLGYYGGPETGLEIPLISGGFPPDFDPGEQHPPDIATPYSLANQLGVSKAWEEERKHRLLEEFTPRLPLPAAPKSYAKFLIAAGVGALAFAILRK
jgi:hypothetical protein